MRKVSFSEMKFQVLEAAKVVDETWKVVKSLPEDHPAKVIVGEYRAELQRGIDLMYAEKDKTKMVDSVDYLLESTKLLCTAAQELVFEEAAYLANIDTSVVH